MPRYTGAYSGFLKRIPEVIDLQKFAEKSSGSGRLDDVPKASALCRSGVVLLSSHIEGYIEDLGEIALERIYTRRLKKAELSSSFLYFCSKDIISQIKGTGDSRTIAKKIKQLFQRDWDIWGDGIVFTQPLPSERFLWNFANPTTDKIKKFFSRFGYTSFDQDMARLLTRNYLPCKNMVDQVVYQRNKIAHGDPIVTSTPIDLAAMIRLVRLFCRATDQVVATWFTSKRCPIR